MPKLTARVFDAADNLIGTGYLHTITRASISERLDEVPTFEVSLPLAAPRNKAYIDQGSIIALYDDFVEIARGPMESVNEQESSLRVAGSDLIRELAYPETGPEYTLSGVPLWQAVENALTAYAPAWTSTVSTAGDKRCENTFKDKQALDVLRQLSSQFGLHIRRPDLAVRRVRIDGLGDNHGYRFIHPRNLHGAGGRTTAGIVGRPQTTTNREIMVNRIIARGGSYEDSGGDTVTLKLPLANRVETATTVYSRTRGGQEERYIEDGQSVARWGAREKVITYSDVVPVSSATADVERAQDALKQRAVFALQRNAQPITEHRFEAETYNRDLARVGDIVTIAYDETHADGITTSINGEFYLTSVHSNYTQGGRVSHSITISDTARVMLDQTDVLVTTLQQMEDLRNSA